jgi:peptidoglycan/LPS O-acetylase OafA/YrhL
MGMLRFVLAASVVLWHAGGVLDWRPFNGTACVNYFFMISGFYMTLILSEKYVGAGRLGLFWSNRFLRLWPSFFILSLLVAFVRFDELAVAYRGLDWPSALLAFGISTSMAGYEFFDLLSIGSGGQFRMNPGVVQPPDAKAFALLAQGWSIGLEIWFYLMAPFVVQSARRTIAWFALGAALFFATRYWVADDIWKYRFFPNIMAFFALGVLAYHIRRWTRNFSFTAVSDQVLLWTCFPVTMVFLIAPDLMTLLLPEQHHLKLLLLLALPGIPVWFEATSRVRVDTLMGDLSYPIYLNHTLVIALASPISGHQWGGICFGAVVLLISVALGYLMLLAIERPIDAWRQARVAAAGRKPVEAFIA